MNKEKATEALKAEYRLEKSVGTIQEILATPQADGQQAHDATKAREACEAINTATADLRNVLYSMFLNSSDNGENS